MAISTVLLLDASLKRHWEAFVKGRPHLKTCVPALCTDPALVQAVLDSHPNTDRFVISGLTTLLLETVERERFNETIGTAVSELITIISGFSTSTPSSRIFVASPVRTYTPRWYFSGFATVIERFQKSVSAFPKEVTILPFHSVRFKFKFLFTLSPVRFCPRFKLRYSLLLVRSFSPFHFVPDSWTVVFGLGFSYSDFGLCFVFFSDGARLL